MKRIFGIALAIWSVSMVIVTSVILLNPISIYAATCTADCGNGKEAKCTATKCKAEDGVGCWTPSDKGEWKLTGSCGEIADDEFLEIVP